MLHIGIDLLYYSERQTVCLKVFDLVYSITTDGFSKEIFFI